MQGTTGRTIAGAFEEGAAKAERLSESAQEAVGRAAEATSSTMRQAGEKGEQLGKELLETQEAWLHEAREYVRQHPIASVAIAVGVGMLIARMRSR